MRTRVSELRLQAGTALLVFYTTNVASSRAMSCILRWTFWGLCYPSGACFGVKMCTTFRRRLSERRLGGAVSSAQLAKAKPSAHKFIRTSTRVIGISSQARYGTTFYCHFILGASIGCDVETDGRNQTWGNRRGETIARRPSTAEGGPSPPLRCDPGRGCLANRDGGRTGTSRV